MTLPMVKSIIRINVRDTLKFGEYLACCQYPAHFSDHRLIATQVGRAFEDKTQVIPEVCSIIVSFELDREAYNTMLPGSAYHKSAIECTLRNHVIRNIVEVEEHAV